MDWKNRIVDTAIVPADQLLANPENWRIHPRFQQNAMEDMLEQVGWVDEVIVNRTTGHVVDGHMRVLVAISKSADVPVSYVELTEEEERNVLATLDPLGEGAQIDHDLFDRLAERVQTRSDSLQTIIRGVKARRPLEKMSYTPKPINKGAITEAKFKIGAYSFSIPLDEFKEWYETLHTLTNGEQDAVEAEIFRRIGMARSQSDDME